MSELPYTPRPAFRFGGMLAFLLVAFVSLSARFVYAQPDDTPNTMRACVLADDMPLSHEGPDAYSSRSGLYIELAEAMAKAKEQRMDAYYTVVAFYKRPVQESLLEDRCDAYFGLPRTEGDWFIPNKVAMSKSFMSIGYALVVPKGTSVASFADMEGKTVAVIGGSPGALAVALTEGVNPRTFRESEPALAALNEGAVDAALIWGPQAGYYNKHQYDNAFAVLPTTIEWPVAIGVRAEDQDKLPEFNALIDQFAQKTAELRSEYGFPSGEPVVISMPGYVGADDGAPDDEADEPEEVEDAEGGGMTGENRMMDAHRTRQHVAGIGRSATTLVPSHAAWRGALEDGDPEAGKRYFNAVYGCAHCHGTDAIGAEEKINLRLLSKRYGEEAEDMFYKTVREGREGTAMPPWEGVISEERMEDIKAFIFSVQEEVE